MKNELDIVNQLLANDDVADCHKPRPTKKETDAQLGITPDEPHVKHMDPVVKSTDASSDKKDRPHWTGDCHKLSKEEKELAGLPDAAYLVIACIGTPNASARVYDPVHWINGWGNDTLEAVKDCLHNIQAWRAKNPDKIADLIKGWEERLAKHSHPYDFKRDEKQPSNTYKTKHMEKTTTDILKSIGL